ncbi:UNVERIFIED_CONTAM: Retrovirus-related Pol polyprotein from type-2 retrotransposable element R2DM [Sesamum radiatum]|uniref:Retrovirus-related Pol polyprotein from type-2 retrotransposable element R2DM n=1 Tax=Sesamum radiatum TaxID=300843 RepID=A0AAW2JM18_SESRA
MEEVIEGGPWLFQGQPIILQKWTPGLVLRKLQHTQVPVWIKLRHLPVELWTDEGLSTVASGVGKPLYPDAITRACTRLDFARVCVMLDINSKLPRHLVIMVPHDDGSESPCKVDIEYEWLPPKCTTCMSLGHSTAGCPTVKPRQPPVHVYVPRAPPRHNRVERTEQHAQPSRPMPQPREPRADGVDGGDGTDGGALTAVRREDKALLATLMINAGFWNVRGLNRRDHQVAIADLASEYHLHFIGLLETRVAFNNVARVQRGLLPRWNYYVDYGGPGNRIWLAWDVDFVDVDVVETGDQFIHCSVCIRALHTRVVITVVYGVNDVIGRRVLWADLMRLSTMTANEPWLVGGDFNTVLDASEVCGQSGDIRGAAEEFQGCLQATGLITLPMQGERFTWHNCSRDSRSLWKRLDRLLVNDRWLTNWPSTTYASLTARTSDHSPLILRGDTTARAVGMFRKLKALKPIFRAQRRKKGDLSNNVSLAAGFLETAQNLLARDRHCPILLHLEFCCKLVLRLASRLEQSMLQQRSKMAWMKDGDQCSRLFFRKVAKRRSSKRVFQIMTPDGQTLTHQSDVTNEFIRYYQELLGGRPRDRFIDLRHLRPWARHILTETEAEALVLPVSPDEVKQALFDIDESKAPGPDGYSAGFFKAAWPVIGGEVTQAIRDFFQTGTVQWIQPEALPPRCALKVDLRKAYDTVEWDFLTAVLILFGFPEQFIQWIVECVTTPSFSVCLNGAPHGFFKGARGLRQGDPMSPFLFVLVMEVLTLILLQRIEQNGGFSYHWRCDRIQLFQLGFADDLLLFSKADPNSVRLFKEGLTVFAELSGLQANLQKSNLILSRSATPLRDTLLAILDFQEGHLPLRYLGLPLLASRLSVADCRPILQKIEARIRGWDGIVLSFAGRVQLIKSVLSALQVYWAMAFILPKHVIKEIEKRLRNFLWKGSIETGYAKVSWKQVCRPVNEGGLGIRDIHALNKSLMSRHLWRLIAQERSSIWVNWIFHYRLQHYSVDD